MARNDVALIAVNDIRFAAAKYEKQAGKNQQHGPKIAVRAKWSESNEKDQRQTDQNKRGNHETGLALAEKIHQ